MMKQREKQPRELKERLREGLGDLGKAPLALVIPVKSHHKGHHPPLGEDKKPSRVEGTEAHQSFVGRLGKMLTQWETLALEGVLPTCLDLNWMPSSGLLLWAQTVYPSHQYPTLDLGAETQGFKTHFLATGARRLDWDYAWKNWMMRRAFK